MNTTLVVHIMGGALGLGTGYLALFSLKGGRIHRVAGLLFVYAMIVMGLSGAIIAALAGTEISVIAGSTVAYLVVTALTTVRRDTPAVVNINRAAMVVGLVIGVSSLLLGIHTLNAPGGTRDGLPAFPFFIMGFPSLFGAIGDIRQMHGARLVGVHRITRHLWRMCYALLIAAMSFFFGQADELPQMLRQPALLATPVLAVFVSMIYWLWRIRIRRALRGTIIAPSAT